MPGNHRNARGLGLLDRRRLLDRVEAVDDDAAWLQRHGLAEGGGAASDRAGAVDDLDLPADRLGRFLDAGRHPKDAAIFQVAGKNDDGLAFLRPSGRRSGRPRP